MAFGIKEGGKIFMPYYHYVHTRSRHERRFPATPKICLLGRNKQEYFFLHRNDRPSGSKHQGFHLFVPSDARPGDMMIVVWVEKTCACVRMATPKEISEAAGRGTSAILIGRHHTTV